MKRIKLNENQYNRLFEITLYGKEDNLSQTCDYGNQEKVSVGAPITQANGDIELSNGVGPEGSQEVAKMNTAHGRYTGNHHNANY